MNPLAAVENEKLAKQIILGEFDKHWGYWYEPLLDRIFGRSGHSLFIGYCVLMAIWLVNSVFMERLYALTSLTPDFWWYCFFYLLVVGSALLLLDIAKKKTKTTLPFLLEIIPPSQDRVIFFQQLFAIGDRKKQGLFCVTSASLGFLLVILQTIVNIDFVIILYLSVWVFISGTISAVGVWFALTSIRAVIYFCNLRNLQMDFINPAKTRGVSKFAGAMSVYATFFALHSMAWEIPYVFTLLVEVPRLPFWNINNIAFYIGSALLSIFFVFIFIYFLYPQVKISALVDGRNVSIGLRQLVMEFTELAR